MKTYFFRADLVLDTPLHLGSGLGHEFIDSLILRDGLGQPLVSGTAFTGLLASHARDRIRLLGSAPDGVDPQPVFQALFGSARGETLGRESRLVMLDAPIIRESGTTTFVQDRNSVSRVRGSAEHGHLFHDEVVAVGAKFQWVCEFREKENVEEEAQTAPGRDLNREALLLFLDTLELLERGYGTLGGKVGTGHGRFHLEQLRGFWMDHQDPDDVLTFALEGPDALETRHPLTRAQLRGIAPQTGIYVDHPASQPARPGPELIIFRGILRPLDPLLVKTGYSTESVDLTGSLREHSLGVPPPPRMQPVRDEVAVDAAFTRTDKGLPYLPGSSLRGCLRSHAERLIRTLIYSRFAESAADEAASSAAWNLKELESQGRRLARLPQAHDVDFITQQSCLVSRLFGSPVLGGRLRFFDAFPLHPERFNQQLKLLDHVAIDRWTGGAAERKKFNSRPFVPLYADMPWNFGRTLPDEAGDLALEVHLIDVEAWQLGLVALLFKDLHQRRIHIGYGKNKGFGRVTLLPDYTELEALTHREGLLSRLAPNTSPHVGGFLHLPTRVLKPGTSFWLSPDEGPLYTVIKDAVEAFRNQIRQWVPPHGAAAREEA